MFLHSFFHKSQIKIDKKPFAGGGEGNLFHIVQPEKSKGRYIAKLYHPHKLGAERQEKLHFLYQHPPVELTENQHPSVVWVKDLLFDQQDRLVGFVMPFIKGEKLEILCTGKLPKGISPVWLRFSLASPEAQKLRLRLCFNIAVAIHEVHSTQNYVLVDLKPDNVIVRPDGLISLVDMDSVEVVSKGQTLFDAPVATPEYTPAEFYIRDSLSYDPTSVLEWDLFALAVIFYKLLFGIHPFAAGNNAPFDDCLTLEQKIEKGLFVHAPDKQQYMAVVPPPHNAFKTMPEALQDLFIQCFVDGHHKPELRPTAEEWCTALLQAIDDPNLHKHFDHLFAAQYFDTNKELLRKSAAELYSDFGIKDDLKPVIKPLFVDFTIPAILPPPVLDNGETLKFKNTRTSSFLSNIIIGFGLMLVVLGIRSNETIYIVMGAVMVLLTFLFKPLFSKLQFTNNKLYLEKESVENRLKTALDLFKRQADYFHKWIPSLKSIDFDSIQTHWSGFLANTQQSFESSIKSIDQQIEKLMELEKEKYQKISENFMVTVRQHPLFKDLEGQSAEALKDALNAQKENSEAWRTKRQVFNDLVFEYRHQYITQKKEFDLTYQNLIDEAKALRELHKNNILEEQMKLQTNIVSVSLRKIPIQDLESIPKYLTNMKKEIEQLQLKKELLKNITFGNFISGKWVDRLP